jgi:hypothetical protein
MKFLFPKEFNTIFGPNLLNQGVVEQEHFLDFDGGCNMME